MRGVVTLYYTRSERGDVLAKWKEVTDLSRNNITYRTMRASHSSRMDVYSKEEIKRKLETCAQWVAAWMYGDTPSITIPASTPLPGEFSVPQISPL